VLLGGVSMLALSGCDLIADQHAPINTTDALEPVLASARRMLPSYDAAIEARPDADATLTMLRDNHLAHVETLAKITGQSGKPAEDTVEGLSEDPVGALHTAESDGFDEAMAACVAATVEFAVLLGEIAACRATHADVLKEI
jgi:hypothetical protein